MESGWGSPSLLQPVQPVTKLCELGLQLRFDCRRHPLGLRKVPAHVGVSLLRTGKAPVCVFLVTHAVGCFGNRGERHAQAQIRPNKAQASWFGFGPGV